MAISYLRSETAGRSAARAHRKLTSSPRRLRPWHYGVGAVLVAIIALAVVAVLFASSSPTLTADSSALAKIGMPLGGGTVQSVSVTGPKGGIIPVSVSGDPRLWPQQLIGAHERLRITVVVKRPGWISWLSGSTQTLHMTVLTPSASLRTHFITVPHGQSLQLRFKQPVAVVSYGQPGRLQRHVLATPQSVITVGHEPPAGTLTVEASLRRWERSRPAVVSWFPAGASSASAVATPSPGSKITPTTPITLTFSKPVAKALGSSRPAITPATAGTWTTLNSHTIRFQPDRLWLRARDAGIGRAPGWGPARRGPVVDRSFERLLDGAGRLDGAPPADAGAARVPAADVQLLRLRGRADPGRPGAGGRQPARRAASASAGRTLRRSSRPSGNLASPV